MKKIISFVIVALLLFSWSIPVFSLYKDENIYYCHKNSEKKIALTFDDGPHPRYTRRILDILKKYGIEATFFVVGQNAEYYPGIIEQISAEGHEIGNHTYKHKHTNALTHEVFEEDVEKCDSLILEKCNLNTKLFRPPEGYVDQKVREVAKKLGYSIILWNIDTRDWEHASASQIEKNVMQNISAGDIILMHDYVSGGNSTLDALERIIPRLLSEGYNFVKVSELIKND